MLSRSRMVVLISWLGLSWLLASCSFPATSETPLSKTQDVLATRRAATLTAASLASSLTPHATETPSGLTSPTSTHTVEPTVTQSPSPTPLENNILGL